MIGNKVQASEAKGLEGHEDGKDLCQQREHRSPPALMHSERNSEPNARDLAGSARARARQV
jgi:hypothetical protein